MRPGRNERTTADLVARVHRRQPDGVLRQLGCDRRGAASDRELCAVIEHGSNVQVGRLFR